jgi:toxin ParE1/3/4
MRIRFTPRAVTDLDDAIACYEGVAGGLDESFLEQLDLVLERLQLFPNGASPVEGMPGVRRSRMRRFPYGVFYHVPDEELIVLRVLHTRRDPQPGVRR